MWRDDAYLIDMLTASRQAAQLAGAGRAALEQWAHERAVLHTLQIIGEAAAHVSAEYRDAHPDVAWSAIVAMRNRIVHAYRAVDTDAVWDILTTSVPVLVEALERLAPEA
jgi:uncharacterized protein with HEPN domain